MGGAITALQQALPTPDTVYSVTGDPGIALEELVCVPREAAAIKLRSWLLAAAYPAPDQTALEEFLRQLAVAADSARPRLQCSAYTLQRFRDAVYLLPPVATPWAVESFALAPGELYEIPGGGRLGLQPADSEGLALAPSEHLRVAWRQGGERCHPVGRSGSNRLKKLLQEYGVPPWWRERVPLLYLGDELLAVGDLWLCQSSRWREAASAGEQLWLPRWQPNPDAAFD
jgi:tRNA(Ile)-lysidine synthase